MAYTDSNPVARIFPHLEVENNNKSPGDEITESFKSCNLRQKGRFLSLWRFEK